jgi:ABC-type Fe3+/spermidine/putrescine transport system ATPase subunit
MQTVLEVEKLTKLYGGSAAVDDVSFSLQKGEFLCLLGPSGCGKTTTLRMIAGFVIPDSGSIRLHGRDIANDAPYRRDVGLLFQSYALFPHMSVLDNVSFGPRMRGASRTEMREKARWALDLVRLQGFEDRKPSQLSGGQQQRVAVARVLAAGASILLLDEPFSNLDAKLRKHMQEDLRELQLRLGIGTIHVTHDQEEAMLMSDRVIIMNGGRIEQEGPAREVYQNPRTAFVADFMGRTNTLTATFGAFDAGSQRVEVETPAGRMLATSHQAPAKPTGTYFVRPEHIAIAPPGGKADGANKLSGTVEQSTFLGPSTAYRVKVGDAILLAHAPNAPELPELYPPGSNVTVEIAPEALKRLVD